MRRLSRRTALYLFGTPVLGQVERYPTDGAKPVWDAAKAYRESTPTRSRLSINGLWRWQPARDTSGGVPADGWSYLRVPQSWPAGSQTAAWYQREVTIPRDWAGRRIVLRAEYLNSYAALFVNGRRAGEMRYPAGELDLSGLAEPGRTQLLSMLVEAMPLRAVMLSYNDTASARQVEGKVARKGLCGDVWLESTPAGARVTDVRIETSVRRWQITFDTALEALDDRARHLLRARIHDGGRQVEEFTTQPFGASELRDGRMVLTAHWRPEKLWDTHTPRNQYTAEVSLLDGGGQALDTALPFRFGFREFWIEGRDFYLNGTRIYLSALPIDNGQLGPLAASYEATRATLERFKTYGINFVYTHNYGCEPGAHLSFADVLRAADDEGMLVSFSQPHFGHYDWNAPDADRANGYARHAAFYVRAAQNHPAVVCYSTSHNSTGYSEDMNPDMIDGIQNPRDQWALRNAGRALRAEAIIRRLDGSRIVYHHSSGNLGSMHTINFYANWAPIQEMCDWFEHWATLGVKPVFTCEYSVPFLWDWAMYRGWYKGQREFGSARAPWEFCVAEWDAQFLGDRAYRISEEEKKNLRWEAEQFRKGRTWQRWDYPYSLNSDVFEDRFQVIARHITDIWRAFRTWGVSANSPWEYGNYWKPAAYEKEPADLGLEIDWENLQRPGSRPAYVREDEARARLAYRPADWTPTAAARAIERNNRPLLGYMAGKSAAFTSKDHNFVAGEKVEKQLIAINNSREAVRCECEWWFQAASGKAGVELPPGEQARIPIRLDLPVDLAPGPYELRARFRLSTGESQEDSFALTVMRRPPAPRAVTRVALFDPKSETAKLLAAMGLRCERVEASANLAAFDTLFIGKGALTVDGAGPDLTRVRDGLKVVVFEQTGEVLETRLGFRIAEYGMRQVFRRVPDHALLAGLDETHLRDWRGAATTLPPRLAYQRTSRFNYAPEVEWSGIPVTRLWRCGNHGNVASALIEKPACGDFLPILDCGYALQYSPLIEYREGRGMVLFCQMDVTGRTEGDPAAATLVRNIIDYVAAWRPTVKRQVAYAGDPAGLRHLQGAGFSPIRHEGGLISGPTLLAGLDAREANSILPFAIETVRQEHISAWFEPFGAGSVFAGVSPAEVHNRDPRPLPLIWKGADVIGNGVLAARGDIVFCQLAPWQFDYSGGRMNVKRTFRRVSCLVSRLMANLGAESRTPLLGRFASRDGERGGLYLDQPEEWDDPYRFFRW